MSEGDSESLSVRLTGSSVLSSERRRFSTAELDGMIERLDHSTRVVFRGKADGYVVISLRSRHAPIGCRNNFLHKRSVVPYFKHHTMIGRPIKVIAYSCRLKVLEVECESVHVFGGAFVPLTDFLVLRPCATHILTIVHQSCSAATECNVEGIHPVLILYPAVRSDEVMKPIRSVSQFRHLLCVDQASG